MQVMKIVKTIKIGIQDSYDVNGNLNDVEQVNYAKDNMFFVSPSSLLTNQEATQYNQKNETAIAPQIAKIDKTEADTANINVEIANNYSGTISEIKILGKIPSQGNTFCINGAELGSNYTTTMLNNGIVVPEELKPYVTVWYSDKENVTPDIENTTNNWTKTPDFSKVKSYLIDLGSYRLQVKETRVFSYKIQVPTTVQYNDISYSTHAVYFCLDTSAGKFQTETETSKLGFSIERKYNLNLKKLKKKI